jgi:hypothetical protein
MSSTWTDSLKSLIVTESLSLKDFFLSSAHSVNIVYSFGMWISIKYGFLIPTFIKFFRVLGMVALKSPVLLYLGVIDNTVLRWTSWPYSNNLSASSKTRNSSLLKLSIFFSLTRSNSLPGVATTTLAPFYSILRRSFSNLSPPIK